MARTRWRFDGEIIGFGTADGDRFVVGRWARSPLGAFTDVMHEAPTGRRTLHAPDAAVAELVTATYAFDDVRVAPVASWAVPGGARIVGDDLDLVVALGRRTGFGHLLRLVPRPLARAPWWAAAVDPIAARVLDGVRTRGSAGGGRREWYGAADQHRVVAVAVTLDGRRSEDLADVWPPVRFGFSSTPRRPAATAVTTTIELPAPT